MKRNQLFTAMFAATLALGATGTALAQDQQRDQVRDQTQSLAQDRERIYGSDLMTPQERNEYRNQMRQSKTDQEREKLRLEHHEQMQERAKARGLTLPDEPPAQRRDAGPRQGAGSGAGMGPRTGAGGGTGGGKGR